ncbi:MAG: tRNA glutamyl-Q(34) synthetase GluQRS [Porticoccaceae bacterium]
MTTAAYIGRFAPSPTGPLHFGSLVCALASFLDARSQGGRWLVRIEDIDPPREIPGATTTILQQLTDHGLDWDGELLYQSTRTEAYRDAIENLQRSGAAYNCNCPRRRITALGGIYDGYCRDRKITGNAAVRLQVPAQPESIIGFRDLVMGDYSQDLSTEAGDFVVQRRDGLFSYQLAVTVDDQFQNISHIIRGADLIDSTARQIYLQSCLGFSTDSLPVMTYGHLPMATNSEGQKLSKQNHAAALIAGSESQNLWLALEWLQQQPPAELKNQSVVQILNWAIDSWSIGSIPRQISVRAPDQY